MNESTYESELWLPRPRAEVFAFFADAANLERITPPFLHFEILTPRPIALRAGAEIDYRLRVHGVPLRWRTRIESWQPERRFVDVQLRGPYRLWRHTHEFEEVAGGTLCRDVVRYAVPGGRFVEQLFVRRDIERIFEFRRRALVDLFDRSAGPRAPERRERSPAASIAG